MCYFLPGEYFYAPSNTFRQARNLLPNNIPIALNMVLQIMGQYKSGKREDAQLISQKLGDTFSSCFEFDNWEFIEKLAK